MAAHAQDLTPSGDRAPMPAVRLVSPEAARAATSRTFFGRISARETVTASFEVGGQLTLLNAPEGAVVSRGVLLAQLDPDPFQRAVARAEVSLEHAGRDAQRIRTLANRKVTAEVKADDAETARELARLALSDAREALEDTVLIAPFDGVVAERIAPLFSIVAPGEPILRLHDMSEVRVEIEVPERALQDVRPEDIAFEATLPDGRVTPVALAEFEATTGAVGQSFTFSLAIPEAAAAGLIPGASATVTAAMPQTNAGALLPPGAILSNTERGFEVMVFEPEPEGEATGRVRRVEVSLSVSTGTGLHVEGIPEDALIVAAGAHLLSDGQTVRRYDGLLVEED
ncbi:MAG: efflux RND transporter periplasmic adaptor subunit [Pseudomonadota bacterium]